MHSNDAQELNTVITERAAEHTGDVTAPVFERYYARDPEARALFDYHDPGHAARMEGSMVEQALYCLMYWHESPGEIEIVLVTTIPHHLETLGVSAERFTNLLEAVCDTIAETIPPDAGAELAAWQDLRQTLLDICAKGVSYSRPDLVRKVG